MSQIDRLLQEKKVIICVGTGGVGKTTTSAALAVRAAQLGKNVLVITVDPAKRLATSLGIDQSQSGPVLVEGQNYSGRLEAALIQPKEVFDVFIKNSAASSDEAARMMNNRLYRQLTTRLSGSQEFTSLEVLVQMVQSEKYDLVVLDTPPAHHAMDFLRAPMKLHSLFQSSVTKWFVRGGEKGGFMQKILSAGTDKVFSALHQLTGAEFLGELREFFELAQGWQQVLSQRMVDVHGVLTGPDSAFILITSFDEAKLEESFQFQKRLKREGYLLAAFVVNRAFPSWLKELPGEANSSVDSAQVSPQEKPLVDLYNQMYNHFKNREKKMSAYREKMGNTVESFRVPEFRMDIHNLEGIEQVANNLRGDQ